MINKTFLLNRNVIYTSIFILLLLISLIIFAENYFILLLIIFFSYVAVFYFIRSDLVEILFMLLIFIYPDYSVFLKIVGVDVTNYYIFLTLGLLFLKSIKNLVMKNIQFGINGVLLLIILLYSYIGFLENGVNGNLMYDFRIFLVFIASYFLLKDNPILLNTSFERISFFLTFFLMVFWVIISMIYGIENLRQGTTISVPVFSSLILLLPYSLVYSMTSTNLLIFLMGLFNLYFSLFFLIEVKSRTVFYIVILEIIITTTYILINKNLNMHIRNKIIYFISMYILLIFSGFLDFSQLENIMGRLFDSNTLTLEFRIKTLEIWFSQLTDSSNGIGIGTTMFMYIDNLYLPVEVLRSDNLFLTLGVKFGIISGMIFIIIYLSNLRCVLRWKTNFLHLAFEILIVFLFLFTTTIMSAQLIYAYSITIIFWVYLISNRTKKEK